MATQRLHEWCKTITAVRNSPEERCATLLVRSVHLAPSVDENLAESCKLTHSLPLARLVQPLVITTFFRDAVMDCIPTRIVAHVYSRAVPHQQACNLGEGGDALGSCVLGTLCCFFRHCVQARLAILIA